MPINIRARSAYKPVCTHPNKEQTIIKQVNTNLIKGLVQKITAD